MATSRKTTVGAPLLAMALFSPLLMGQVSPGAAHAAARFSLPFTSPAPGDRYPLDAVSRTVPGTGPIKCPRGGLVSYSGSLLHYARPMQIHHAFRQRLRAFETIVRDVAIKHYGRAPRRISHLGTLSCRRIRGYPEWLSEHALGNAIDISGFDFGAAPRALRSTLARSLRGAFQVTIVRHWSGGKSEAAVAHERFLKDLATHLVDRPDIFRVLLGPAYPGHKDHFHFDMGPYRLIEL